MCKNVALSVFMYVLIDITAIFLPRGEGNTIIVSILSGIIGGIGLFLIFITGLVYRRGKPFVRYNMCFPTVYRYWKDDFNFRWDYSSDLFFCIMYRARHYNGYIIENYIFGYTAFYTE